MAGDYGALRSYVASRQDWAALDRAAKLAALNAHAGKVPAPMYFAELTAMVPATISAASFLKVWQHDRFDRFYNDVLTQNVFAVENLYPAVFVMDGTLQQAEAAALVAYASRTVDGGPTVAQSIAGWDLPVTADDLAAAGY